MAEAILFCGIQATGKSTFYRQRFTDSHVRINLDTLKTRAREAAVFATCLETAQSFVVDNTNVTIEQRARYIVPARAAGFRIIGYYFKSSLKDALARNALREGTARIPAQGIGGTASRLQIPTYNEGFDELYYVQITEAGGFQIQPWNDEL